MQRGGHEFDGFHQSGDGIKTPLVLPAARPPNTLDATPSPLFSTAACFGLFTYERSQNMNWDQIEGKWKQMKGSVKEKWGKLTNDDLDYIAGSRDKLIGKLQERYGYKKEEASKYADNWYDSIDKPATSEELAGARKR